MRTAQRKKAGNYRRRGGVGCESEGKFPPLSLFLLYLFPLSLTSRRTPLSERLEQSTSRECQPDTDSGWYENNARGAG